MRLYDILADQAVTAAVVMDMQAAYGIIYCRRYEPWGIVDRREMPWFDVRFRGYGRNKIVFTAALNASGFSFEVSSSQCNRQAVSVLSLTLVLSKPTESWGVSVSRATDLLQVNDASFIIHRPHEASSGSFAFSSDAALQGHIVRMYTEQVCKCGRMMLATIC